MLVTQRHMHFEISRTNLLMRVHFEEGIIAKHNAAGGIQSIAKTLRNAM